MDQTTSTEEQLKQSDKEDSMDGVVSSTTSNGTSKTKPVTPSQDDSNKEADGSVLSENKQTAGDEQNKSATETEDSGAKKETCPSSPSSSSSGGAVEKEVPKGPLVSFKAIYNGKKYDMEMPLSSTILELKEALSPIIGVMPAMQKIMIKGLASDDKTLSDLAVNRMSKVLVVGSKLDDIVDVNIGGGDAAAASSRRDAGSSSGTKKEPLCAQKIHQKIIDKGVPEDAHPGIKLSKEALPSHPISGMVNKSGGKVRLTFKLELDQVWIGTKQRTEKVNMSSIRSVVSEPISGHEQYHIMGLQLGTTEASRYWLYWVPAQYVDAIKSTVLGTSW